MIRTDYFQQQTFKYLMKDYLATPYPSRNYFMLQVVQHQLANQEQRDHLRSILGDEGFKKLIINIKHYEPLYIFDMSLRDKLDKISKITDNSSEQSKKYFNDLKKAIEKELKIIAIQIPLIDPDLIRAWTILIQNTDLKNISIPVEQVKHQDKYRKANLVEGRRPT